MEGEKRAIATQSDWDGVAIRPRRVDLGLIAEGSRTPELSWKWHFMGFEDLDIRINTTWGVYTLF